MATNILPQQSCLAEVEAVIAALGRGEMIVLADNEERENESDLVVAADAVTPQQMATIIRYTTGIVCVAMVEQRADALEIQRLLPDSARPQQQPRSSTAFAMPVDAIAGLTTGVSAVERATTARMLSQPSAKPSDFVRPGHVFPLIAHGGGVKQRRGHTEASVDLVMRARRSPAAVLAEMVNDDGSMMRRAQARAFAQQMQLRSTTIDNLLAAYSILQ